MTDIFGMLPYGWDFNQEREFMENLLCTRFNFLLVVYSLILAAAAATSSQSNMTIVLYLGSILTFLISITIWRCYVKFDIVCNFLHHLPDHPFECIRNETKAKGLIGLTGVNSIIGLWIPLFCFLSLLCGAILAGLAILKPT
jgi:hypothetical protein